MDHDFAFPNPIERTDLPVPRKKWKYVLAIGLVLFAILFALLPQILSSKIGRSLLKAYLESEFRGEAFLTDFRTSWFGPTEISKFAFNDPESRQIRFQYLSAPIGVIDLLRGNYDLHGATIRDLYVDFVVDYGDGTDSLTRLTNKTLPGPGNPAKPIKLPNVHGEISFSNATITLSRGTIELRSQFRTNVRTMRFANVEGTFNIASLDQPFTCLLKGAVGGENNWGAFTAKGTLDLGDEGLFDLSEGSADVQLSMTDVPNQVGTELGSLLWILVPTVRPEHYEQMFGPTLAKFDMDFKIGDGKLRFERLDVQGRLAQDRFATLRGRPVINLASNPRVITIGGDDGQLTASVRLSRGLAEHLALVNPFFNDALTPGGDFDLTISNLSYPLRPGHSSTMSGTVAARDVALVSGQVLAADKFPRELTTQWQAITGNFVALPVMMMSPTSFAVKGGFVTTDEYQITIDDRPLILRANNGLIGRLRTRATVSLSRTLGPRSAEADNTLETTIVGTPIQPQLELSPASATAMSALIDENVQELKARKAEQLLQKSQQQVEQLLSGFDRMKRMDEARGIER